MLLALLRTLWRLSYQEAHDWLCAWPALARACGLPQGGEGLPLLFRLSPANVHDAPFARPCSNSPRVSSRCGLAWSGWMLAIGG